MAEGVLTGRDPASGAPLRIAYADGRITSVAPGPGDAEGYVSAGLIDLQINGYLGHDLNDGAVTPEVVARLAEAVRASGVTTFLPTIITGGREPVTRALEAIAAARRADPLVAHAIAGVHLEGPWIASEDGPRGAHRLEHVRPPDLDEFDEWQGASGGIVKLVTLSPHFPDTPEVIRRLVAQGVHVAIGHTGATPEQIRAAAEAGATLSTHLGNGISAMLARHPNPIWTQLAEDLLTATFIGDGHHLPADTLTAMLRAKGLERSILVSDTTALGGMPPGRYHASISGDVELNADGRLSIPGTPYLAGAALSLPQMVVRTVAMTGIGLADALALSTINPGRFVGGRGRLEVGADADLIRFGWQPGDRALAVDTVILKGTQI